jgi:hypothetical protein
MSWERKLCKKRPGGESTHSEHLGLDGSWKGMQGQHQRLGLQAAMTGVGGSRYV